MSFAVKDDLQSEKALSDYAETRVPSVYDDFIDTAKKVLTAKHRDGLIRVLEFKFKI